MIRINNNSNNNHHHYQLHRYYIVFLSDESERNNCGQEDCFWHFNLESWGTLTDRINWLLTMQPPTSIKPLTINHQPVHLPLLTNHTKLTNPTVISNQLTSTIVNSPNCTATNCPVTGSSPDLQSWPPTRSHCPVTRCRRGAAAVPSGGESLRSRQRCSAQRGRI